MSPILSFGIPFVLGIVAKAIYDWKIYPIITKSRRQAEQRENEEKSERARERQLKLDRLNEQWKLNREALRLVEQPLKSFNQMNRFPDEHNPAKCLELAAEIEGAARRLEGSEYEGIKARLLEYSGRRDRINTNSGLKELTGVFQRLVGDSYEPALLWRDARRMLEATQTPPFSEKDV